MIKTGWVNVYQDGLKITTGETIYETEEQAIEGVYSLDELLETIQIKWQDKEPKPLPEITEYEKFSQGVMADGTAILRDGVPIPPEKIVSNLNNMFDAVVFYANPGTYHAISVLTDPPCGDFAYDFGPNSEYDYDKPGAVARNALKKILQDIDE